MTKLVFHIHDYISKHIYGLILSHKAYSRPTLEADWPNGKCMQSAGICGNVGPTWACHHLCIPPLTLIPLPLNSKQIPTTQGGAPITSYKRQQTHPCTPDRGWGGKNHMQLWNTTVYMFASISALLTPRELNLTSVIYIKTGLWLTCSQQSFHIFKTTLHTW